MKDKEYTHCWNIKIIERKIIINCLIVTSFIIWNNYYFFKAFNILFRTEATLYFYIFFLPVYKYYQLNS